MKDTYTFEHLFDTFLFSFSCSFLFLFMFLSLFLSALSKVWVGGIIFGLPGSVLVVVDPSATSVSGRLAE